MDKKTLLKEIKQLKYFKVKESEIKKEASLQFIDQPL